MTSGGAGTICRRDARSVCGPAAAGRLRGRRFAIRQRRRLRENRQARADHSCDTCGCARAAVSTLLTTIRSGPAAVVAVVAIKSGRSPRPSRAHSRLPSRSFHTARANSPANAVGASFAAPTVRLRRAVAARWSAAKGPARWTASAGPRTTPVRSRQSPRLGQRRDDRLTRGDNRSREQGAAVEQDGVASCAVDRRQSGGDVPTILQPDCAALRQDGGERRHGRCAGLSGATSRGITASGDRMRAHRAAARESQPRQASTLALASSRNALRVIGKSDRNQPSRLELP